MSWREWKQSDVISVPQGIFSEVMLLLVAFSCFWWRHALWPAYDRSTMNKSEMYPPPLFFFNHPCQTGAGISSGRSVMATCREKEIYKMCRTPTVPGTFLPIKGRSFIPCGTSSYRLLHYKAASYRNYETIMIQSLRVGDQVTGPRLSGRKFFILNILS